MIKVLHVLSSLGGGGVESMLYNYYLHLDKSKILFDFVVHGYENDLLENKMKEIGSKVFHVTPKKNSFKKNMIEIDEIIKNGKYDVVHCHQNFSNFSTMLIAKKNYVPVRISHAHGFKNINGMNEKVKIKFLSSLNRAFANYLFACGIEAGKWLYGEKWILNSKNIIMNNAIDLDKFSYNMETRERYRELLKVDGKIVLLHVGRFSDEKNQLFLVDIMEQLSKQSDKYILLLAGNGGTEETVRIRVQEKGLSDKITFLGVRSDVSEIMNAADVFLLPSKHEGFGVALIEAQATGLPVLASDAVPRGTSVTNLIQYLTISNANIWVEEIFTMKNSLRKSRKDDIKLAGYSIDIQAIRYQEWLEAVCNK